MTDRDWPLEHRDRRRPLPRTTVLIPHPGHLDPRSARRAGLRAGGSVLARRASPILLTPFAARDDRTATAAATARQLWGAGGLDGVGSVVVNVRDADIWQSALTVPADLGPAAQLGGTVFTLGGTALASVEQRAAVQTAAE